MKVLVTTAFALTLFLSALVVTFALQSDSLDGEPYETIALRPPSVINAGVTPEPAPVPQPVEAAERLPAQEPEVETVREVVETSNVDGVTEAEADDVIEASAIADVSEPEPQQTAPPSSAPIPAEVGFGLGVGNLGPIPEAKTSTN